MKDDERKEALKAKMEGKKERRDCRGSEKEKKEPA